MQESGSKTNPEFLTLANIVSEQIYVYLEEISLVICDYYNMARKLLTEEMEDLSSSIRECAIINIYTLYKVLRDVSVSCRK